MCSSDLAPPDATMIDIGVASPNAQGQAMIRTATAAIRPWARRGSGPQIPHTPKAMSAISRQAGTKQHAAWSARRWIGARDRLEQKRSGEGTSVTVRGENGGRRNI